MFNMQRSLHTYFSFACRQATKRDQFALYLKQIFQDFEMLCYIKISVDTPKKKKCIKVQVFIQFQSCVHALFTLVTLFHRPVCCTVKCWHSVGKVDNFASKLFGRKYLAHTHCAAKSFLWCKNTTFLSLFFFLGGGEGGVRMRQKLIKLRNKLHQI